MLRLCRRAEAEGDAETKSHCIRTSNSDSIRFEGFIGILAEQCLRLTESLTKKQLREHIAGRISLLESGPPPLLSS